MSQDGHLDRGVDLDEPGLGSWTGIATNVQQYDVDRADTLFILQNGTVSRGLNFDHPGDESWTTIGYGMQSFTVDNADTVFCFSENGTLYRGLGLDQTGGGSWLVISYDMQSFTVDANDTVFSFGTDGRLWAGLGLDQPGDGSWNVIGTVKSFAVDNADTVFFQTFNGQVWRARCRPDRHREQLVRHRQRDELVRGRPGRHGLQHCDQWHRLARGTGLDQPGGGNRTELGTDEQEAEVASDGTVYMLDQGGNLRRIQGLDEGTVTSTVTPNVQSFTLIDGGTGLAYLGTNGSLYQEENGTTTLIHTGVASLTLGSDGSTVYFLTDDWSVWEENGGQVLPVSSTAPGSYTSASSGTPDFAGFWYANGTEACEIIQSGTNLTFINEGDQGVT